MKIRYLQIGEAPTVKPYLLVNCIAGAGGAHVVRHADGMTETISLAALGLMLPVYAERADEEGFKMVYVEGASRRREALQSAGSATLTI